MMVALALCCFCCCNRRWKKQGQYEEMAAEESALDQSIPQLGQRLKRAPTLSERFTIPFRAVDSRYPFELKEVRGADDIQVGNIVRSLLQNSSSDNPIYILKCRCFK